MFLAGGIFGKHVPCLCSTRVGAIAGAPIQLELGLFVGEQSHYLLPVGGVCRFTGESTIAFNIQPIDEPVHCSLQRLSDF
jgi:hypothetical protein